MPKNLIDEVVSASPNRRSFMKTIAAATAGVGALSMAGLTPAEAQTTTEVEVLKFALNLEFDWSSTPMPSTAGALRPLVLE